MKILSRRERLIIMILVMITMLLCKLTIFNGFDDKYYYDSLNILNRMKYGNVLPDFSFEFTTQFYNIINVFGFSTLFEFALFLSIVGNLIIINVVFKYKILKNGLLYYPFTIACIFLANMNVFTLSKEFLQFLIYSTIFFLIMSNINTSIKILLISMIFIFFSINFRNYLVIVLILIFTFYFFIKKVNKSNKSIFFHGCILLFILFISLYIAKIYFNSKFIMLVDMRKFMNTHRIGSSDALTIIMDLIPNEGYNVLLFLFNYIINFIRILFPIELIFSSVRSFKIEYLMFAIFQLLIGINLLFSFKKIKRINLSNNDKLLFSFILSYYFSATLFEPDFGTLVRHEMSIIVPLYYFLFVIELK